MDNKTTEKPYGDNAEVYHRKGWHPVPLPPRAKANPPEGYTGRGGALPSGTKVFTWANTHATGNLALRFPDDMIGVDVDDYGDKTGGATLDRLESELGELPRTVMSSAREGVSGIRYFRVPAGREWKTALPDIDILQRKHRYAVAPPSVHPSGSLYRWRWTTGEPIDGIPDAVDIPELPAAWRRYLDDGSYEERAAVGKASRDDTLEFFGNARPGPLCLEVQTALNDWLRQLENGHHDAVIKGQTRLISLAVEGHAGVVDALSQLRDAFLDYDGGRDQDREWCDALLGAVARAEDIPAGASCGCDTGDSRSQLRLAEVFALRCGSEFRYVDKLGTWFVWSGAHWSEDETGEVSRALSRFLRELRQEATASGDKAMVLDITACSTHSGFRGILSLASFHEPISRAVAELDADPYLFNTPRGTVDLRTGSLREARREDTLTKLAGGSVERRAKDEHWTRFVESTLPDDKTRGFVQRLMGYAMFGEQREHIFPLFTGTGANGKTTLTEAVAAAFGDYAVSLEQDLLTSRRPGTHTTGLMDLRGARLALTAETEEGAPLAAATVKKITGGDSITARKLYKDNVTWRPSHTVIMSTNHKPDVDGADSALFRRLRVVEFDQSFRDRGDPELLTKLRGEMDAVMTWCFDGWLAYQSEGLNPPPRVMAATREYAHDSDPFAQWLEERTEDLSCGEALQKDLFASYGNWFARYGTGAQLTVRSFPEALRRVGKYAERKTEHGKMWSGLRLQPEEKPQDDPWSGLPGMTN